MRIGINPKKKERKIILTTHHRIILVVYLPNEEGFYKDSFEVFNIGTGKGNTVLEVIHAFEESTGMNLNYSICERREGDIEKVYADTSRSNQILGWKARKTLHEMMASAWAWEKQLSKSNK